MYMYTKTIEKKWKQKIGKKNRLLGKRLEKE